MIRYRFLLLTASLLAVVALCPIRSSAQALLERPGGRMLPSTLRSAPILFVENIGQWGSGRELRGRVGGATVRFEAGRVDFRYLVERRVAEDSTTSADYLLGTEFVGARHVDPIGESAAETRFNYYLGPDGRNQHSGARGFQQVRYRNLYDGIDALYYENDGRLKYDFILSPDATPSSIQLRYSGARSLRIARDGALEASTPFGVVREEAPYCYQMIDGKRVEVRGAYRLLGNDRYGFRLGRYDKRYPVTIDPCLSIEYLTYLSGGGYDIVTSMASDSTGNAYAVGFTRAPDFKKVPDIGNVEQDNYIFVTKLSPDGASIIYSTLIARNYEGIYADDGTILIYESIGEEVEVTPSGEATIAMTTQVDSLPTSSDAYMRQKWANNPNSICGQRPTENFDCYVVRLDQSGVFKWGTYLGGSEDDYVNDLALDAAGNAYLTGMTFAPRCGPVEDALSFPVTVAAGTFNANNSVKRFETFVSKISADGRTLPFSALYGGDGDEVPGRIELTRSGRIYLTGMTNSPNLRTTSNAYQQSAPGVGPRHHDLYVVRIDPASATLEYSSYLGTAGGDFQGLGHNPFELRNGLPLLGFGDQGRRMGLLLESDDLLVLGGTTYSSSLPTTSGAFQGGDPNPSTPVDLTSRGADIYILRFNVATNQILSATYLGGTDADAFGGITRDVAGNYVVASSTMSKDYPVTTANLQQTLVGGVDAAVSILSPDLTRLGFSTFLGGRTNPSARLWEQTVNGLMRDRAGAIYMFGGTLSDDLPLTPKALQRTLDYYGGYIAKFAAPEGARISASLLEEFPPDPCQSTLYQKQIIFNVGGMPLRIDSIRIRNGKSFSVVTGPGFPLSLEACDTISVSIGFIPDPSENGCDKLLRDTLDIYSSNAIVPRESLPLSGRSTCANFFLPKTSIVNNHYAMNSNGALTFDARVQGAAAQYVTVEPDPANKGIFVPSPELTNAAFATGVNYIRFVVNAPDTGRYCESFNVTVQPCDRKYKIDVCARVVTGIFRAPERFDLGLVGCETREIPFHISNPGNDTLVLKLSQIIGPSAGDVSLVPSFAKDVKIGPGDSMLVKLQYHPMGIGQREARIVFKSSEGFPERQFPTIVVTAELDSTALRLTSPTTSTVAAFGDVFSVPIDLEPLLLGRVPISQFAFQVKFDPTVLALDGATTAGTLMNGWSTLESYPLKDGYFLNLRRVDAGAPIAAAGRLVDLRLKVLRGEKTSTPYYMELAGVSKGCLSAEIDTGWTFRLDSACLAYDRLVYTGRRVLKQSIPNPAGEWVRIPFTLPETGRVTLTIYDMNGVEIALVLDEVRQAGDDEISFHTGDLPPGKYFYRMIVGDSISDTRQMVIER